MNRKTLSRSALGAGLVLLGTVGARADGPPVSFSITVGNPPPVYAPAPAYAPPPVYAPAPVVVAPPSMVWLPEVGAYVALGLQQPVFYIGGVYYQFAGGGWYAGPSYGGPWRRAGPPPGALRRFHDRDWDRYQRMAREHEGQPHWRQFRPGPMHGAPRRGDEGRPGDRGRGDRPGDGGRGHWDRGRGHDRGDR